MTQCSKKKKEMAEELGLHLEKRHGLSPLASRTYAIMVLSNDKGFAFEELVEILQASKSSVSTNLTLLVQLNYVEYYTKPGDRKRYYRGTGNYLFHIMNDAFHQVEKELHLVKRINNFNKENNPEKFYEQQSVGNIFQEYLESQNDNLQQALQKMMTFQDNYKNHQSL